MWLSSCNGLQFTHEICIRFSLHFIWVACRKKNTSWDFCHCNTKRTGRYPISVQSKIYGRNLFFLLDPPRLLYPISVQSNLAIHGRNLFFLLGPPRLLYHKDKDLTTGFCGTQLILFLSTWICSIHLTFAGHIGRKIRQLVGISLIRKSLSHQILVFLPLKEWIKVLLKVHTT